MWLKVAMKEKIGNSDYVATSWIYNKINDEFIFTKFFNDKFLIAINIESDEHIVYEYNKDLKKYEIVSEEICKVLTSVKTFNLNDKNKIVDSFDKNDFVENPENIIGIDFVLYRINAIDDYSNEIYLFDGPAFLVNDEGKTFERVSL